jgi:predicted alpha/beta hydrolase family esterase
MKRGFLILHGLNGSPPGHWQFWLAQQLTLKGEYVRFPDLPEKFSPQLDNWLEVLQNEFTRFDPDCKITVISHSLACALWLHAAYRYVVPEVHRLFLVAPPWLDETNLPIHSFLPPPVDQKSLHSSAREIKLVYTMADPVCPKTARAVFESKLELDGICLPDEAGISIWTAVMAFGRKCWIGVWQTTT